MALLFAINIIERKWKFKDVPSTWRDEVKEILIERGEGELIR